MLSTSTLVVLFVVRAAPSYTRSMKRELLRHRRIELIAVSAVALVMVVTAVSILYKANNRASSPAPMMVPAGRVARTVTGTDWSYTVAPEYESKFVISVRPAESAADAVLLISGRGCNAMSAAVHTAATAPEVSLARRSINGAAYVLSSPVSTLMACEGAAADYDTQLLEELQAVFATLYKAG